MGIIEHLKAFNRLMTVEELASILTISPKTIYTRVSNGSMPHIRIAGSIRFDGEQMAEWIEARTVAA